MPFDLIVSKAERRDSVRESEEDKDEREREREREREAEKSPLRFDRRRCPLTFLLLLLLPSQKQNSVRRLRPGKEQHLEGLRRRLL